MDKLTLPALGAADGLTFLWNYMVAQAHPRSSLALDDRELAFVGHCFTHYKRSAAQLFQDLYVTFRLPGLRNGFFVEFGATDGFALSNTYHLETDHGWSGVLAEPAPQWHARLHATRRARIDHRCVWWESGKPLELVIPHGKPELTTVAGFTDKDRYAAARSEADTVRVESVSLDDLLAQHDAPAIVDYLSVDTEGTELDILSAFSFDRYKVRVLTVEHNYHAASRADVHRLLAAHGFVRELEAFSRFDDWYYHPERV